jgi:large subunit ribosomal protein L31
MKKSIHPKLHDLSVHCRCGNSFIVPSTLEQKSFNAENCSKCLPMHTGIYKGQQERGSARERLFKNFDISQLSSQTSES